METDSRIITADIGLDFDDAVNDSPLFRASLQRNEDELDELSTILDTLVKSSRSCLEYAAKLADALGRLAPSINRMTELVIFEKEKTPTCLSTIIEFVETTFVLHERLVRDLGQRLLIPMIQSVQDDLREIRDQRRQQDKWREKYDALLAKYNSLPKLKEYALIREDTYLLYEGRKQYYDHLLTYVQRINKFRRGADLFFVDKCLGTMETLRDFACSFSALVEAFKAPSRAMRMRLTIWQREAKQLATRMENQAKEAMTIVGLRHSPDAPYRATEGVVKRGHLYRKRQKTIGPGWKRVWLCINNDCLVAEYFSGGRRRGQIERSYELHVLLCEIKPWDGDRRHCFEVATSRRSLVYQAETEEDMRDWLRVFDNAKAFALQQETAIVGQQDRNSVTNDDGIPAGDESVDESASMHSRSAPVTPHIGTSSMVEECLPFDSNETLLTSLVCMWQNSSLPTRVGPPIESKENNGRVSAAGTQRAMAASPVNPSSLGSISVNNGSGSEPGSASFGKLYGTEKALYLCSDLFGVEERVCMSWIEIQQFNYKLVEITGLLTLTTTSPSHNTMRIHTISDESTAIDGLRVLWKNCRSSKPKTVAELRESLSAITGNISIPGGRGSGATPSAGSTEGRMGAAGTGVIKCRCESHLERTEYDAIIPMSLDSLTDLLFSPESTVYKALIARRRYKGIEGLPPWTWSDDGEASGEGRRSLDFVIPVNHPLVKLKETECHEEQWMRRAEGWVSVLKEAKTPAVIYGDAFMTQCLVCLTSIPTVTDEQGREAETRGEADRTRLRIFTGVKFLKNPFVKSMIRSNTLKGLADYVSDLTTCLWDELRRLNPEAAEERVEPSAEEQEEDDRPKTRAALEGNHAFWSMFIDWLRQVFGNINSIRSKHHVGLVSLLLSITGIFMMFMSIIIYWRVFSMNESLRTPFFLRELPSLGGDSSPFFNPHHQEIYEQLEQQRENQRRAHQRLQAAGEGLEVAQLRLARLQHAIWVADRLSKCYASARIPTRDCSRLEKQWSGVLDAANDSMMLARGGD